MAGNWKMTDRESEREGDMLICWFLPLSFGRAEIFYPSMKALARQMGKDDEFEELIIRSQSILPPKGA